MPVIIPASFFLLEAMASGGGVVGSAQPFRYFSNQPVQRFQASSASALL